jgi:ATP/maltotriose-dependent transcriptional regulator MalT/DNA-binding SARP family transcriptional activator
MAVPKPGRPSPQRGRVDTAATPSVSFSQPDTNASVAEPTDEREPIAVGPGRQSTVPPTHLPGTARIVNTFPIQGSKVQRPVLRDETLARDRLLAWLDSKIHQRVVFVTAEAGYGKTTLLADFSRRTRLRTLWYRLDEGDRDWVTVLHYLVAAGREVDPAFAPTTASLLSELGSGGSSMAAILATFIRELQLLGEQGGVLVLDDFHMVEGVPDVQRIMREIVMRAPERLTIVILSRREPALPIARLRALGELAELTREDLRFDDAETEQLFRETYRRPLEADVLLELNRHTEGWAASLQLVQSALRERSTSETRIFVRGLSGAHGTLHDYLAEEVVGDLAPDLQAFLMRTSILTAPRPEYAAVAAGVPIEEAERHLEAAERLGLLPRVERMSSAYRYHRLVADFLGDRLRRDIGVAGIADLHRAMARFGEGFDWKLAAHHYAAAGDIADLQGVLVASIQDIMGSGGFALAESYVNRYPELEPDPSFGMFLSRRDLYRGDFEGALARAQSAVDAYPPMLSLPLSHLALANLAAVRQLTGDVDGGAIVARQLEAMTPDRELVLIARGILSMAGESTDGDLVASANVLNEALTIQTDRGHQHYMGITHLNLAFNLLAQGLHAESLAHSDEALELLGASSAGTEMATLHAARAMALLHLGRIDQGVEALGSATASTGPARATTLVEAAGVEATYGDPATALDLLAEAAALGLSQPDLDLWNLLEADLTSRGAKASEAAAFLSTIDPTKHRTVPAYVGWFYLTAARVAFRSDQPAGEYLAAAKETLQHQRSGYFLRSADMLQAIASTNASSVSRTVLQVIRADPAYATVCADDIALRLGHLRGEARDIVFQQARERPRRWRPLLRRILETGDRESTLAAAVLLDEVGEDEDINRLRTFARSHRSPSTWSLGRGLARRLAAHAHFDDLGHIVIRIGERTVDGSAVRRKVLTLACFLLARPGFAATRDQVLEALWPDLAPSVAVNSLNQTVYFLRRVFEERYREDESANYVQHDGEIVRLDPELVSSQSGHCRGLIDAARGSLEPSAVATLSAAYAGRFAMDFEYEDWSSPFRETLHAAYLDVIEQAVRADSDVGMYDRAALLARRAIEIDPDAESLEIALLRLYRSIGSHSAAAEQYSHYQALVGDAGSESPIIGTL